MTVSYSKKNKTQGHLRSIMTEDYGRCRNSIQVAQRYQVSHTTVLHWHHHLERTGNLSSTSSAPIHPHRKYEFEELYLLHYLYKTERMEV